MTKTSVMATGLVAGVLVVGVAVTGCGSDKSPSQPSTTSSPTSTSSASPSSAAPTSTSAAAQPSDYSNLLIKPTDIVVSGDTFTLASTKPSTDPAGVTATFASASVDVNGPTREIDVVIHVHPDAAAAAKELDQIAPNIANPRLGIHACRRNSDSGRRGHWRHDGDRDQHRRLQVSSEVGVQRGQGVCSNRVLQPGQRSAEAGLRSRCWTQHMRPSRPDCLPEVCVSCLGVEYAGDITPLQAWKLLSDNPEAVLVDVRTDAEWRFVGVPDLSSLGREIVYIEWNTTDGDATRISSPNCENRFRR